MSTVFIGGSRHVLRLAAAVRARLDIIVEKAFPVIVGDANGADKAMQTYLFGKKYERVEVFCSGATCRNNVGGWKIRQIDAGPHLRGYQFYAAKDRVMAQEADYGFMVWDGESTGTLLNALRLLRQNKKVVVYSGLEERFADLTAMDQWDGFLARYGVDVRSKTEQKVELEDRAPISREQPRLFPTVQM